LGYRREAGRKVFPEKPNILPCLCSIHFDSPGRIPGLLPVVAGTLSRITGRTTINSGRMSIDKKQLENIEDSPLEQYF